MLTILPRWLARTPRCVLHMCTALTRTARPRGAVFSTKNPPICFTSSSWICKRDAKWCTTRSYLDNPMILPSRAGKMPT